MLRLVLLIAAVCPYLYAPAQKTGAGSISPALKKIIGQGNGSDSIDVSVSLQNDSIPLQGVRVLGRYHHVLTARMRKDYLLILVNQPGVVFINQLLLPTEELTTGAYDLSLNGISFTHARLPLLKGNGLIASIKERDFDTGDIDIRNRVLPSLSQSNSITAHASLMTTIIAGAANSSPFAMGAAPRAYVTTASFFNLFPEQDQLVSGVSVQNHSYGTVVEAFYGNEAAAYDLQSNHLSGLLHVFSAGNSGNLSAPSGTYAGLTGFANLTGNFKQAKNMITVGSVDSAGLVMPLSSKGPAYDGRIKPELVAYGEDGSSGAAALVSGAALLVDDAYSQAHTTLADATLVKAALLNSADDIDVPHPDYSTGFGNLNAYRAIETIRENRFTEGSIIQNEVFNFPVTVPPGIQKLRVMLAWNDPSAIAGAAKALVNDLDLQVQMGADSWNPWVLDPAPDLATLHAPGQRKKDTLNNVEQVTIELPASGLYMVTVKGSRIPAGAQHFFIVYQLDSAGSFQFSFPAKTDHLISGNRHWLRWETTRTGPAVLEYATDGNNWRTAGMVPDLDSGYFIWQLPDTLTNALLRMRTSGGVIGISDSFTISPQPLISVGYDCADSVLLYWKSLPVAAYTLYELDSFQLKPFLVTPDTAVIISKQQHPSIYFSVSPVMGTNEGIRANTLNYTTSGTGCYLKSFFLQNQLDHRATFFSELGTGFGVTSVSFEKLVNGNFQPLTVIDHPSLLQFLFTDPALKQGENHYQVVIHLANGTMVFSNEEIVYFLPGAPVLLYPSPVRQGELLHVIISESGRFSLQLSDMNGRQVMRQDLNSNISFINTGFLARGIYLARIVDTKGKAFSQKILVY